MGNAGAFRHSTELGGSPRTRFLQCLGGDGGATGALKGVTKVFPDGTVAVDNVNLDVGDGEFMVLLGPSGCGKSTVLRMVAGLEDPSSGAILLDGELANDLAPGDRRIAMVFQDFALYPHMTVGDNIGFPLRLSGVETDSRTERVADVASALGIGDVLARRPSQLSGGQRQRVAMGRAIVRRPGLFLMDEPLSNLDSGLRAELRAEISGLTRELGVTTLYVTHDQAEALTMADRVAIMRKGVLQDVGTPTQVYGRPATLYVAAFLGAPRMNLLEAQVYVHLDRHIALHMGEQTLYLPWNDIRARAVAHYHGERVGAGLSARVNGFNGKPAPGGRNSQGIFSEAGRHHRRPAELAVRLAPYPAINNGHPLAVAVRMEALHFFDDRGQRIDVGWR